MGSIRVDGRVTWNHEEAKGEFGVRNTVEAREATGVGC